MAIPVRGTLEEGSLLWGIIVPIGNPFPLSASQVSLHQLVVKINFNYLRPQLHIHGLTHIPVGHRIKSATHLDVAVMGNFSLMPTS